VPSGDSCTVSADCCAGSICHTAPGSTMGTCIAPPPPSVDAGPPPDGGVCATYGQACTKAGDCCTGIPCLDSAGLACDGVKLPCFCRFPLK
jgi:hypothetical protein